VAALLASGLGRVFVTDWRSASPDMRFLSIDSYLGDLNVVVDELGGRVHLRPVSLRMDGVDLRGAFSRQDRQAGARGRTDRSYCRLLQTFRARARHAGRDFPRVGRSLAKGRFVALGRRIDLFDLRCPVFLLAAREDDVVAPAQIFATEHLVDARRCPVEKAVAPCRHLGLFMGRQILADIWPNIARWLLE